MQTNANTRKKIVIAGWHYAFFTSGIVGIILGSLIPFVLSTYQLDYSMGGMLLSAHSIGNLVSGFIAGVIPLYIGRKKSIVLLLSASVFGFLGIALTGNPVFLLLSFLLTGITRGSVSNFGNTIVAEATDGSPRALNTLHSFFAIGAFFAPFIVLWFTKDNPELWKISSGIVSFLALVAVVLFMTMQLDDSKQKKKEKGKPSYTFMKNMSFWVSTGILFFYLCFETAISGWLVTYFKDANIMSTDFAQTLASLLWLVILVGRLICAYLLKFVSKQKILLFTATGTTIFFIFLLMTDNLAIVTLCIIGLGFSMAGIYPTAVGNVGFLIKSEPMAMGILLAISGLGAILMPYITGVVAHNVGILGGMAAISVSILLNLGLCLFNFIKNKDVLDTNRV